MADGQIRIGPSGEIPISVWSVLDEPAESRLRAEKGKIVLPCPPPGGLKVDPYQQLADLQTALSVLGEIAREQDRQQ